MPSTNVLANSTYEVAFSTGVDPLTVTTSTINLTQDGVKQLATVSYDAAKKVATLEVNGGALTAGKEYVLTVNGVKDAAAVAVPTSTTKFTVSVNPILLSSTYLVGATVTDLAGAVVDSDPELMTLTFNKDMDITTINTTTVKIYDITDSKYIAATVLSNVGSDPAKATIQNTTGFETEHDYRVEMKAGLLDLAGNAMTATNINFFYGYTAPSVTTTSPSGSNVYNRITASGGNDAFKARAQFSVAVDAATVNTTTVQLIAVDTDAVVDATVTYEAGSRYAILVPKADLAEATDYKVVIDGVKTAKGLAVPETTFTFTTGEFTLPTVVSTVPANAANDVAIDGEFTVNFSKEMDETTLVLGTDILFEDVTDPTATAGYNFASWTSSLSQDGKTLTIKIPTNNQLDPNKTYRLTIKKTAADASSNSNALAADVKVLFNTEDAAATVLSSVQTGTTYATTNTVVVSGVTNVAYAATTNLFFNFDQALAANSGTYVIADLVKIEKKIAGGSYTTVTKTDYTLSVTDNSGKTLKVDKTGVWDADTTYRVTIPTTVKDVNGNGVQKVEFIFTTGDKPVVDTVNSMPANFETGVAVDAPFIVAIIDDPNSDLASATLNTDTVKVIKTADSSVAPYSIENINYVKKPTTTTAALAALTNSDLTFAVTDSTKFAVGDIITFSALSGTYVVSAATANTVTVDRAVTGLGNSETVTFHQGVVYALDTDAELAGDTEYKVQVSGVQDKIGNTADAKNITFRTTANPAGLKLLSSSITDGATGVAVNAPITLTFNEEVTVNFANIALVGMKADGTTPIAVTTNYKVEKDSADKKIVKITPLGYLPEGQVYTVSVPGNVASAGGAIDAAKTISFQTELTASVEPLITAATYFDLGTEGVNNGDVVRLTLSQPVGTTLAADTDFLLDGIGSETFDIANGSGNVAVSADGKTVTITLGTTPVLAPGVSTIEAALANGNDWTDKLGNAFDDDAAVTIVKN